MSYFEDLQSDIKGRFAFADFSLSVIFSDSERPPDSVGNMKIGNQDYELTFVSYRFLEQGVDFFRPFIRGFMVLIMILYSVKNFFQMLDINVPSVTQDLIKGDSK